MSVNVKMQVGSDVNHENAGGVDVTADGHLLVKKGQGRSHAEAATNIAIYAPGRWVSAEVQ